LFVCVTTSTSFYFTFFLLFLSFFLSVNWCKPEHVHEAHRLMRQWHPFAKHADALELLDYRFADLRVREYAIECLSRLTDEELAVYMLQLTQALKFESYHDSPLSRFLLERALRSPYSIGHSFYWNLKAELHLPQTQERFGVVLEEYLAHCGR
jgi:phosphatidylinositol-4,5-bisphosphate 3-kinase